MEFPFPISSKTKLIAAISGGPDSVYLLDQLSKLKPQPQIIVAHLNHNTRGVETKKDQEFTKQLAKKYKFAFETKTLPKPVKKGNLEDQLRQKRYRFLEEVRRRHRARAILTAHHLNDQIETFFLNLIRGASGSGFGGINYYDPQKKICRPLLKTSKQVILTYLKKHQLKFRTDQSNFDLKFKRNFLRHKILPLFSEINPRFEITLEQTILNLKNNLDALDIISKNWLKSNLKTKNKQVYFYLDNFLKQPVALQSLILKTLFKKINQKGITTPQIKEILATLSKNKANLQKEFGNTEQSKTMLKIRKDASTGKRKVVIETLKS